MGKHIRGTITVDIRRSAAMSVVVFCLFFALPALARADDAAPPQIKSFSVTPKQIDTAAADQVVTVTLRATDDGTGIACGDICFAPSTTSQEARAPFIRVAGDAWDGTYQATLVVPMGSQKGKWAVRRFEVGDQVGNEVDLQEDDLVALFGAGCASFTNIAASCDSEGPQVTACTIMPREIDTGSGDQTVTVRLHLTDDQAGINSPVGFAGYGGGCSFLSPRKGQQAARADLHRVAGHELSGDYEATVTLRRGCAPGVWPLAIGLIDRVGNWSGWSQEELERLTGAGKAELRNTATTYDSEPPRITALTITPSEVDTEAGEQTVTVSMRITDDQAGVNSAGDEVDGPLAAQFRLESLIGTQSAFGILQRVSGSALDGVYEALVSLPRSSKEGVWRFGRVAVPDKVGNMTMWWPGEPDPPFPGLEGMVVVNTATAREVTIEREWTLSSGRSSVTFPEGTLVTRADDGRFAFSEMTAQQFTLDDSIPTTDLDGVPVATFRFGIPGLNLSFSKPVAVAMAVGSQYNGYRLYIQSLTEGGAAWANEKVGMVTDGRCRFTVSHATRFAASLAPPIITRMPRAAGRGDTVTIVGKGFGKRRGRSVVRFGSAKCATYANWSATRITCRVPATAKIGRLKVKVTTSAGTSRTRTFVVRW